MNKFKKEDYYKLYIKAHNNAISLLKEAAVLHSKNFFPRAYFLAFTGLEEIAKSQMAADVYTNFIEEKDFWAKYTKHSEKIERIEWASHDAENYKDWETDTYLKVIIPNLAKRMKSLYVGISGSSIESPEDAINSEESQSLIHTLNIAIERINEMTEYWGHQIGTKGFMK